MFGDNAFGGLLLGSDSTVLSASGSMAAREVAGSTMTGRTAPGPTMTGREVAA